MGVNRTGLLGAPEGGQRDPKDQGHRGGDPTEEEEGSMREASSESPLCANASQ